MKVLLAEERKICDQIFDGITFNKDQCFDQLAGRSVMTLLSFGDIVAKSKRSHENLFALLQMYGVMHGLQSEVCGDNARTSHCREHVCKSIHTLHFTSSFGQLFMMIDIGRKTM